MVANDYRNTEESFASFFCFMRQLAPFESEDQVNLTEQTRRIYFLDM